MLRRLGGKKMMLGLVAACVFTILLLEGQLLAGVSLRNKVSNYTRYFTRPLLHHLHHHPHFQPSPDLDLDNTPLLLYTTRSPIPLSTTPYWLNVEYARRRVRSDNVCSRLREGGVDRLTRFGNTSYCVVPKVGCTFWLNIFRFLHGDTGNQNVTSPFDIPRMITHYGTRKNMKFFSTNSTFAPSHLANDFRFMFVREPYSRLWSAYVDKFLLVDYWRSEGKNIVKLRAKKDNMTKCANDISFQEYLQFISTRKNPRALNEHWRPIQFQCSPCLYQPHVIGKMETFSQDSRYVLQVMNASWILDSYNHQLHVYQEMDMLITYNFQVINGAHYINCTNATDLSHRLWKTFQINGYIPRETPFPDPGPRGINSSEFRNMAYEAYKNRPHKSSAEWHNQREQMMLDAFKEISAETLQSLKKVYQQDFDLFGYDPEPYSIFGDRKKSRKVE